MAACGGSSKKEEVEVKEDDSKPVYLHYETTALYVKDMEASKKFYKKNFGMCVRLKKTEKVKFKSPVDGKEKDAMVEMMILDTPKNAKKPAMSIDGHIMLMMHQDNDKDPDYKLNPEDRKNEERHFGGICFNCDDMKTSCEKLEKNGVKFLKKFGDKSGPMGGKGAKCEDLDGTPIILSARPKTGVFEREWTLQQTILRTKDVAKMEALLTDLGMVTVMSNKDGGDMGFKFRWLVAKEQEDVWAKACSVKLPGGFKDFGDAMKKEYGKYYHTNLELISNKDQKIDTRAFDPMIGFLCDDLKKARDFLEGEKKCNVVAEHKDSFVIQNDDGGFFMITEFKIPAM